MRSYTQENIMFGKSILVRMFIKSILLILFLISFSLDLNEIYAQPATLSGFEEYVEEAMTNWNVPGLAIAVVKDNQIAYAKGFGVRDIRKNQKVDANTMFAIASNTKAFTTTALGLLVEEDKISWDDPVLDYLPEFQMYDPVVTREIKIRDLLCHRSGLGTWAGDLTWFGSTYDREEVMKRIRFVEPVYDFRTSYGYCNLMYLVAGQIIPQVSGMSWDAFIKKRLFEPLGMKRSNTSVDDFSQMENVATPHIKSGDELIPNEYVNVDNSAPAGAINSCVNDIAQWLILQLGKGYYNGEQLVDSSIIMETRKRHTMVPLSARSKKRNPSTHFLSYGLGWYLSDYQGRLVINHTGGLDGMYSYVGFLPEEELGVVVLTNTDNHTLMRALPYHVYDAYLGVEFQDWSARYLKFHKEGQKRVEARKQKRIEERIANTEPSYELSQYAGTYNSQFYGDATIEVKDGKLTIQLSAHPHTSGKMEHWQFDTFLAVWDHPVWDESFVYFNLNDRGEIEHFRVSIRPDWIDTREYTFVRSE